MVYRHVPIYNNNIMCVIFRDDAKFYIRILVCIRLDYCIPDFILFSLLYIGEIALDLLSG